MTSAKVLASFPLLAALLAGQGIRIGPEPVPPQLPPPDQRVLPRLPGPQVRLTEMRISAQVVDGVATVELRQTLRNDGATVAEAEWIQPLPPGAVADRFTMTVAGKETAGEVLDGDRARSIYESIVRRRRDPGLLEYAGSGCLRAKIFPIDPGAEIPVVVRWRQLLPRSGSLHTLAIPLRAAGHAFGAPTCLTADVSIRSRTPIKSVWTPIANADVVRRSDHEARLSLERRGQQAEADLQLFYGVSDQDFGVDLLTFARPGEPGWFLLMLAPKHDWPALTQPKRITFVIDTSGSMQGEKITQARAALKFFVESLQPHDWFDVVPFSTEARPFFPEPVPATAENRARAIALAGEIEAKGGTNIEDALARAMRAAAGATEDQVPITVFLTDGLPTVGTTDVDALLAQATQRSPARHRVFVFGVGNDVNTRLLDSLAERTRGDRDYVREGESIEQKTGTLFEKLAHPVLTDVVLRIEDIEGFDVLPKTTPDLFKGSRLVVVGRYRGAGARAIRLEGRLGGQRREFLFEGTFPADSRVHDFVPALWAQRRVAFLLDQIRLNGQRAELIDEITRLGKQYGLVTPYTSHLIVEEGMRLAQAAGRAPAGADDMIFGASTRAGEELRRELGRAGGAPMPEGAPAEVAKRLQDERKAARDKLGGVGARHDGPAAVADSTTILRLAQTASPTGPATGAAALVVRRIRDVTLYLAGDVWIDARMRPELRDSARKIVAFSDEYFALLAAHPELAPLLAFSTRLLLLVDDGAVEISAALGSG